MSDDDARTTAKFLRGLTIGALVGAVLAGSSIWGRRRRAGVGHGIGRRPDEGEAGPPAAPESAPVEPPTPR